VGEAHRTYVLLTRELGLVYARAQGVRFEKSKLRYHLQDYARVSVNLLRGRDIWRITGAADAHHTLAALADHPQRQQLLARIAALLRRLLQGEERNDELTAVVESFLNTLVRAEFSRDELAALERVTVLRILASLGYVSDNVAYTPLLARTDYETDVLHTASGMQRTIVTEINRALRESHL
jgi:recombinational DNA repair protein (RecF pathway)